ncbi:MarR family transcriptional regulator [Clostridium sp. MSJ-11]|uniref:MarR family transcriptional regulator n=1 Tax=Clostridium mobile TaxID=2841512 RepID=A0ABS6ELK6_9CLOT|nr:MarR family transcriptional regulator [Clostridium mobile]MBU5485900.1 MarR family transcriptional regulator [Clostridium mobile]
MFNLDDCIGIITSRGTKEIVEAFNHRLALHDITRVQWIALYYIGEEKGITQKDLADKMNIKESTVARLIDRMEKEGTVERIKNTEDRRVTKLHLTEKGSEKREAVIPIGEEFSREGIHGISQEHLKIFKEVLQQIITNVNTKNNQ